MYDVITDNCYLIAKEEIRVKNNFSIILAIKHKKIADVHRATGISKYTLTQLYYQRVKNPQTETVTKIADYLECSLDELLARTPYVVEV